jgi:hypothetical protein
LGRCPGKMRFSAVRYSFCSSSCWFARPVTYAHRRAYCAPFMQENHHRRSLQSDCLNILTKRRDSGVTIYRP